MGKVWIKGCNANFGSGQAQLAFFIIKCIPAKSVSVFIPISCRCILNITVFAKASMLYSEHHRKNRTVS